MDYTLIITEDVWWGYSVEVLELSWCISEWETKKEAIDNVKEAILLYLESIKEIAIRKASSTKNTFVDSVKVDYETV